MNAYNDLFETAGQQYNVDPRLLQAMMRVESSGNPKAVSPVGAQGLMQIMPATAKSLGVKNAFDPNEAIPAAARLMAENLDRYGNVPDAVMAYHGGTDKRNWGPKTKAYVTKVASAYEGSKTPMASPNLNADPLWQIMNAKASDTNPDVNARLATDPMWQVMNSAKPKVKAESAAAAGPMRKNTEPLGGILSPSSIGAGLARGLGLEDGNGTEPNYAERMAAGVARGFMDVPDAGAKALTYLTDKVGLTEGLREVVGRAIDRDRAAYDERYGDSIAAGVGRIGGNVVTTAPFLGGAGKALAAGGNALTGAMASSPSLAQAVPAAQAVGRFVSGQAGSRGAGAANRLIQLGSRGTQGAALGAGAAALIGEDPRIGAAAGFAVPVAGGLARDAGAYGGKVLKAVAQPFYAAGRAEIADDVLREFSKAGPTQIRADEIIPGSRPTLSQATGNPGIASVERVVRDVRPNVFGERAAENVAARERAMELLAGTKDTVDDLIAARSGKALPKLQAALAKTEPADPAPVIETIDDILKSPAGQRDAVVKALARIKEKIVGKGAAQTDAAQLYGIRQSITDDLSPLATASGSDAKLAASELMAVKDALDDVIEAAAPGYRDYLQTYASMSKPIDAAKLLQGLNLTDARGNITLGKIDNAIKGITKKIGEGGVNKAKALSSEQLGMLHALREDLLREGNTALGKSIGSNTFQNFATNNLLGKAGAGIINPENILKNVPLLNSASKAVYKAQNEAIMDELANRLLNPSMANLGPRVPSDNMLARAWRDVAQGPLVKGAVPYAVPAGSIAATKAFKESRQ